ncbi:MAG: cadherin repeat domain-containing protein [Pirellulales bacterium]
MSQREKFLGLATVAVVVIVVVFFGYRNVMKGFDLKSKEISTLREKIKKNDDIIFDGEAADKNMRDAAQRSLPRKIEIASTEYRKWLLGIAQQVELEQPIEFNSKEKKDEKGVFVNQSFTFKAKGNPAQLLELLYLFHEKDYLHRLSKMQITPVPNDPVNLNIILDMEALSLAVAGMNQEPPKTLSNRLTKSLDDYKAIILERNIFSPLNQPPSLRDKNSTKLAKGEVLRYEIGAKDPEGTPLQYSLSDDAPRGMKVDAKTGTIQWEPKEIGDYEVKIVARDGGFPTRQVEQTLKISVTEPPPPPVAKVEKKFDIATQASVTALLAGGNSPEVWINSKIEGKVLHLKVGDSLELGSVKGKVVAIGANFAEMETEGKRWIVSDSDKNIAEAYKRMDDD